MIIEIDTFSRKSVKADTGSNYLFTDNADRKSGFHGHKVIDDVGETWYTQKYGNDVTYPNGSQAVIRGLENAYPISTMKAERTQWEANDFEIFKSTIDDEIETIISVLKTKPIKINLDRRIGQGKYSRLTPEFQQYLDKKLMEIGLDNRKETPIIMERGRKNE